MTEDRNIAVEESMATVENEIVVSEVASQQMTRPWRPEDADKEFIREATRRRVRNAHMGDNATFIPAKPKESIDDEEEQKVVAVYARVSTLSTDQVSSIENQTKYYTEKVGKKDNWELQEIYSDEGKSGTSMKRRTEFVRMLKAAKNQEFDLIITASVSRFARNVSDCIEQVRLLKTQNPRHPVGVYFETEGIYTLDPDSDQLLYIHAMLAEWESGNKSRRMILSYDQRICTGQYPVADLLGYRHTIDGELIIEEEEAKTVRFIFLAYFLGYSYEEIAEILTDKERPTLKGRTDWNAGMVRNIMTNERRWGDLSARKTIVIDYVKRTTVKNDQIRDAAFVEGHHEGIVSPEIAKAVHMVSSSSRRYSEGVSDLAVITQGTLKGFVCVIPGWGGIDANTFLKVCEDTYTDEELNELQEQILGQEDVFGDDSGYQIANGACFITSLTPTITLSRRNMRFTKACIEKLDRWEYVQFLYHPIQQVIIVRQCEKEDINAVHWIEEGQERLTFSSQKVCEAIYTQMNWIESLKFRIRGIVREREGFKMMVFFLDDPQIISEKGKTIKRDIAGNVIYKKEEVEIDEALDDMNIAYSNPWMSLGTGAAIKKYRASLLDGITADDIVEDAIAVENPLIGSLPTRDEVLREVEELLMSM